MSAKHTLIEELIRPVVEGLGFQFWGMEYISQGKHSVLRIFIETDKEKGIDVEDCAQVSRQVSSILDVEDPITGEYNLEVSSPGLDRPLFELSQYESYVGSVVALKLRVPFDGRRKFKGQLTGVEGDEVVILVDQEEYLLPIELIEKANIVPQF
ncbi:ribosome maturation factor RimP [Marinomonas mediterranea]|uniref:Ribosome maturation factor RimP n=1 Tax=Marinomonas mediterranea (strain ATCC 700492 / JCM 21426 / NBRC 103028 / MMB-1) TaxID=717774 RepID=F2K4F3_MARM1|nr:ribosome maturation factor RimP [Marinomonas mediterranea]ADZ90252.1 Ribosome maturation factor rimP [Marinomonas mediterranea MMB-1]WCN08313.1 ribosome maturation factor RimP [Marinomonas mediterranea]WCN12371.1 ribosome maturation factor RimP [Marinomonas mediterranea]WCN16444.1 ribosome maturation factor RimP [Marinomonas mediterranea MMB-1]